MKSIFLFIPMVLNPFNMIGQSPVNTINSANAQNNIAMNSAYDPFVVELETWYDNPDKTISFKIDYTPIAGTSLSPYGLVCRVNGQLNIGPYGGPTREIIVTDDIHVQVVPNYSTVIDLRSHTTWIQTHYNGMLMPLYLSRNETTVFGLWIANTIVESPQSPAANPIPKPYGNDFCVSCSGMGSRQCGSCAGTGYTTESVQKSEWNYNTQSNEYRYVHEQRTCIRCSGGGRIICAWCNGRGYKQ